MEVIKTRTAMIFLDENSILHLMMCENVVVDYEDAIDNSLVVKNLTNNKPCLKLVDIRNEVKFTVQAKTFIDSKEVQNKTIARAVLINSTVKRVSYNFFIKINSQEILTKFFIEKKEAIEWLLTFKI